MSGSDVKSRESSKTEGRMKQFEPTKATDTQLVDRFENGRDQRAFAEIVRRHGAKVMSVGMRVLDNRSDAEDVFQATFLALAMAAGKIRDKESLAGWLQRVAQKSAVTLQRKNIRWERKVKQVREQARAIPSERTSEDPTKDVANEEMMAVLDEELARLPEKLSTSLLLCEFDGLSQRQAAEQLGISKSAFNERVAKARKLIREGMSRRGITLCVGALAGAAAMGEKSSMAMSNSVVADITDKATLYAAGKTAGEIGVTSTVFELATGITTAMKNAKIITVSLAALAIVLMAGSVFELTGLSSNQVFAGFIFEDTFADGEFADGMPVTWTPDPAKAGIYQSSPGQLVIQNSPGPRDHVIAALREVHEDTSLRVNVRVTGTNWAAGVASRSRETPDGFGGGYFATAGHFPGFGGSFLGVGRAGISAEEDVSFTAVNGAPAFRLPFDIRNTETTIQLDVFGDRIQAWAWPAGEDMPLEPAFDVRDSGVTGPGFPVLTLVQAVPGGAATGEASFSYVGMASHSIPEPSTSVLSSIALVALVVQRRRRRF